MSGIDGFFDELRKRGVVRAALLYVAAAFALLEFADIAFRRLGLPDSAVNWVLWIGITGFPIAMFAAWAIEIRAERDSDRTKSWVSPATVATALALVGLGAGMGFWWGGSRDSGESAARTSAAVVTPLPEREPAVAVLRFTDLDETNDHGYFAAGMSEEISTALSRFPGIRVIAPSATEHFEEPGTDVGLRASELGVTFLLRGSVRRGAQSVRVAAQLLDTATGAQVWGENYDAVLETGALIETQDRIAGKVAAAVGDSLGVIMRAGRAAARRRGTDNFEAYDCVLLGHAYLEIHATEIHARARDCLEEAVRLDPDYADAWAHLAYAYREEFHHHFNEQPGSLDRSLAAGRRAIELDAANPMAHFAMAQTYISRGEFDAGIAAMQHAVELNPNDTVALASLATYHVRMGHLEEGLEMARELEELNPLHPGWLHTTIALYYYQTGEYRKALDSVAQVRIQDDVQTLVIQAAAQAQLGQPEASATIDTLRAVDPSFAQTPMSELRHYFLSEETVAKVAHGLRLAGLEIQ